MKSQLNQGERSSLEEKLLKLLGEVPERNEYAKRIPVKTAQCTVLIVVEDIDWVGGAGNYLELHCGNEVYLIRERFHQLEQKLNPRQFVRIHRSVIVNIDRIKTLHPMFNSDYLIILHNGVKLNVSRTYHEKLLAMISR